jgi:segregation and condensation protein B
MSNLENDLTDGIGGMPEGEEFEQPKEASADSLRILEAILFASDELLTTARLRTILPNNPDAREISGMVEKINRQLQNERHPFEIVEIGGGYQFKTVAYYHPWVRQIFSEKAAKRLSVQALECLSIIAYRQPLSKAEIEAIRGVLSDGAMKTLLEKRLVTITGRSEKVGRPLLYGTTPDFLKYFGLNKISDLPRIEEFEAMAREKMDSMGLDELKNVQSQAAQDATEEATIEISLPAEAAAEASSPAGREAAGGDDAGVFEAAARESAPPKPEESQSHGLVMEAETVFQPAVKDDREMEETVVDEQPVITVKPKKRKKGAKKELDADAVEIVAEPAAPKDMSDGEAVFEAPGSGKEAYLPDPIVEPKMADDEVVFEAPVIKKEEPLTEPVEAPNREDTEVVFEAPDSKKNVSLSERPVAAPKKLKPRRKSSDDEAVFEVAAEKMDPEETTRFAKETSLIIDENKEEEAAPKKTGQDDDALFEAKM